MKKYTKTIATAIACYLIVTGFAWAESTQENVNRDLIHNKGIESEIFINEFIDAFDIPINRYEESEHGVNTSGIGADGLLDDSQLSVGK